MSITQALRSSASEESVVPHSPVSIRHVLRSSGSADSLVPCTPVSILSGTHMPDTPKRKRNTTKMTPAKSVKKKRKSEKMTRGAITRVRHSPEMIADVVRLAKTDGYGAAARAFKVPFGNVARWVANAEAYERLSGQIDACKALGMHMARARKMTGWMPQRGRQSTMLARLDKHVGESVKEQNAVRRCVNWRFVKRAADRESWTGYAALA